MKEEEVEKGFAQRDVPSEELFKSVLFVIDQMLQLEMGTVMSSSTKGEDRIHSAGRLDALNDALVVLQDRRSSALNPKADQTNDSKP